MIALLTSVVFMMMAYRDSMLPPLDKNYTLEVNASQPSALDSACNKQINCVPELKQ